MPSAIAVQKPQEKSKPYQMSYGVLSKTDCKPLLFT